MTALPPDNAPGAADRPVREPKRSQDKPIGTKAISNGIAPARSLPAPTPSPPPPGTEGGARPRHTADAEGLEAPGRESLEAAEIITMLDSILEIFPKPAQLPAEAEPASQEVETASPEPRAEPDAEPDAGPYAEPPGERLPHPAGDDIFPMLPRLLPVYRFPLVLLTLAVAVVASRLVPADYALRPVAVALHVLSLVVSFGAVLAVDWDGLLWLTGPRDLAETTRLAAGTGPLIWLGLGGLIASGALLHPDLSSPLTVTKLLLVLAVAWNGVAVTELRRRLAQLPPHVKPGDLPRRDWRLLMGLTVVSQVGWWGAVVIGFVTVSS